MVILLLLLLSLQSFNQAAEAENKGLFSDFISGIVEGFLEAMNETEEEYDEDIYKAAEESLEWLLSLLDEIDECDPNPCYNNGTCKNSGNGDFKCICPRPFKGKRCQDVINVCKNVKCGRGECIFTDQDPFYECKCYAPFQPPNCRKASPCNPSPCLNGGTCVKGHTRTRFHCECPENYSGKFCQVGPGDCYEGDGSSYRGFVSETVSGDECMPWNSHLIMHYGPFDDDDGDIKEDGIGPHNYCRNPDGESQPWCFVKDKIKLRWNDCNVTRCHEPSSPTSKTTLEEDTVKREFSECGKPWASTITSRIFGGRKSKPGAYPWQASMQTRLRNSTEDFSHFCGGTLLNSCWVLTAAHCIDNTTEMQGGGVLGGVDLMKEEAVDQTVEVEYYIMHENYTTTDKAVYNDIALLKLKPVSKDGLCARETRFVKAACLPPGPFPDEMTCTISGYGVTEKGSLSKQLLDTKVLLINQSRCMDEDVLGEVLDDSTFSAGRMQGGVDTCQGDSGGPLSCKQNDIHYIYGVVSWGYGCGIKSKPGVYARVTHFIDWINEKMRPM